MNAFATHFRLTEEDVIIYAKDTLNLFSKRARLRSKEIGDGNINYVFRVWDEDTQESIIIKQADILLRSSGRPLDIDRSRIEAEALKQQWQLSSGFTPKVYQYDPIMCAIVMEDLSDHQLMRTALLKIQIFPLFAEHISSFLVNTLLPTTDLVMESANKKALVKKFINMDLCKISEDLVFTEPFFNHKGRNIILDENMDFVEREIYNDSELVLEASKLKHYFMNNAQALIHGDLHTGSILVKIDSTKVMDPEFAFYGPIGYDLGNVIANLFFGWANILVTKHGKEAEKFILWLEETIEQVVDLFKGKFIESYQKTVTEVSFKKENFMNWYLEDILEYTAGTTGLEIIRRVVGDSKVIDITGIEDRTARIRAERMLIMSAKRFIKERDCIITGKDYTRIFRSLYDEL